MVRINLNRLKFYIGQRGAAAAEARRIEAAIDADLRHLRSLRTALAPREELDGLVYLPSGAEAEKLKAEIKDTEDRMALQATDLDDAKSRLLDAAQFADTLLKYARQMGANLEGIN